MSTRKPSASAAQKLKSKKVEVKDLSPKAPAAERVKGGPINWPNAGVKGKKR